MRTEDAEAVAALEIDVLLYSVDFCPFVGHCRSLPERTGEPELDDCPPLFRECNPFPFNISK